MATARPQVHELATPLTVAKLAEVRRLLRAGFPNSIDPFPQEVKFKADYKKKWLPTLSAVAGFSVAGNLLVECDLDEARLTPDALAEMFRVVSSFQPVAGRSPGLHVDCPIELPQRKDHFQRSGRGDVSISIGHEGFQLRVYLGGISHCRDDGTRFKDKKEEASFKATERRQIEEMFQLAIDAGRLPLRLDPSAKTFTVEPIGDARLVHLTDFENYHLGHFDCTLPNCTPDNLARRFFAVLDALPSLIPRSFAAASGVSRIRRDPDPVPSAYALIQSHPWPFRTCKMKTSFRIENPEALDGVAPFLTSPTAAIRADLIQIRPPDQRAKKPAARLMVKARRKDHSLSLSVPPALASMKGTIEMFSGLKFV